ncbi:hypothetical protein CKALI_03610 [Corynebacterium kalinowskii]|uniref:Uncharacterized protein n=1 Tax=Corynebacterium kalinowskii TaxID=2675216 RepID=A0A6B8VRG1_9CORY|nr:hypothetical protein CKALI_03610 [Corynebacterium kalinowskii]
MTHQLESVVFGNLVGPRFHFVSGDFYRGATFGAHQVVVMVVGFAVAVQRFTTGHVEDIHGVDIGKRLKRAVNGGESHLRFAFGERLVDFLGRREGIDITKDLDDRCALAGASLPKLGYW